MAVEAQRQYHVDTFTIRQRLNKTILVERLRGLIKKDFPLPDNWQEGYRYYLALNQQRIFDGLDMRMEVFDAIFSKGQTMKIPEFPYVNRFQLGAAWKPETNWSTEKTQTYSGGFLLERVNYPLWGDYSYILVLPPIFNWIERILINDYEIGDFQAILHTWLYGNHTLAGRSGNRFNVYLGKFLSYRLCFQLFLNYDPYRDWNSPHKTLTRRNPRISAKAPTMGKPFELLWPQRSDRDTNRLITRTLRYRR